MSLLSSEAAEYDGPGHLREKADYATPINNGACAIPSPSLRGKKRGSLHHPAH